MQEELGPLVNGFQVSQAIHVAAVLGIADLLEDGPRTSDDLAAATDTHPRTLYRLLRALAAVGVLREDDGRTFSLTPLGDPLRSDAPDSIRGWAAFVGRAPNREAWTHLIDSVRTGENAFRIAHGGMGVWEYRAGRPEESAAFDGAMVSRTRIANRSLLDAYDFGRFGTVVDVGGGRGALLAALVDAYPSMQGVLFDQPHVVDGVELGERVRVVAGSFFETVPEGGDAYLLKWIVHDWEDEEATAILRACRRAMGNDATLLVVERELGSPESMLSDLNMLVGPGGQERTRDEFAALFEAAGFRLAGSTLTASGNSVIEAAPV
jgi:O-methyltransferase/methyltransferase family protein